MRPALLLAALLCCASSCAVEPSDARCLSDAPCQEVVCAPEVNYDCEFKRGAGTVERQCDGVAVLYSKDFGHKSMEIPYVCAKKQGTVVRFNSAGAVTGKGCYENDALVDTQHPCAAH